MKIADNFLFNSEFLRFVQDMQNIFLTDPLGTNDASSE